MASSVQENGTAEGLLTRSRFGLVLLRRASVVNAYFSDAHRFMDANLPAFWGKLHKTVASAVLKRSS
jgi:hypothetical protein